MARSGSSSPDTSTNTNAGSPPSAPPPPPPPSAPTGPTGTAGFSVAESSIQTLQGHAVDLESRYQGVSSQLSSQKLAINALGMFGIPMAVAVNGSNSNSVDKANQAATTMGQVNAALKATSDTQVNTDQFIADQFGKIVPDSGAKNPNGNSGLPPKAPTPSGPKVAPVEQINGGPTTAPSATPAPTGPQVAPFDPITGGPVTAPSAPQAPAGPQVAPVPPLPGAPDVTSTAAAQAPAAPPVAPLPNIPGAPNPTRGNNLPGGPPVVPMPNIPGGPTGPRPGVVPNVPGVNGPPKGIFSPPPPAAVDSLRPIAAANPPAAPRPAVAPNVRPPSPPVDSLHLHPPVAPLPVTPPTAPPTSPGLLDPRGYPGGENLPAQPGPKGETAPPVVTTALDPNLANLPLTPPKVAPINAPPNILDLLDPRGYPGGTNLEAPNGPKADGAWPATTIDGKPWADLSSLTPEQSQKWVDNLRNILNTKEDGAFFWSGSVFDSDGNRVSVMDEAGQIAQDGGRNTLEGLLDDKAIKLPGWGNTSPEGKAVWDSVSASLAHGSSGDVYVLLGPSRRPDNVFDMTEFPILQQNDDVKRVIAIDVQTKAETIILDKKKP